MVQPCELSDVSATELRPGVHLNVVTPRTLRGDDHSMEAVDIYRSDNELVVDVTRYREREEWELPISPEAYARLLEHVVTVREEAHAESSAAEERLRHYRPELSPTDARFTVGILLPCDHLPNLSLAHTIGLKVAAQVHAATLALLLTPEGARIVRDARPDPAIPPSDYLRLTADELHERGTTFEAIIAEAPAAARGVFEDGLVTVELVRVAGDRYEIQVMSILARSGKMRTIHPVTVKEIAQWCERAGAPVDAFEWRATH